MKKKITKYITIVCLPLLFLSCKKENTQTPTTNYISVQWEATVNGEHYSFQGNYSSGGINSEPVNNPGTCEFLYGGTSYSTILLEKDYPAGSTGNHVSVNLIFYEPLVLGTYHICDTSKTDIVVSANGTFVNAKNTNITLNITEIPTKSGALVKGNFSGYISKTSPNIGDTIPITCSFQAFRL